MDNKERMLANLPYKSWMDGLNEERMECKKKLYRYNNMEPELQAEREKLLREILGKTKEGYLCIESPFHCDYGYNIFVGEDFFMNFDCVFLDAAPIRIGAHCMIGPKTCIYAIGHPLDAESRRKKIGIPKPVTIGDNVWIGGGVTILPGVTIGDNTVVAAASVVTKSFPGNVVVAGNPARIIRELSNREEV